MKLWKIGTLEHSDFVTLQHCNISTLQLCSFAGFSGNMWYERELTKNQCPSWFSFLCQTPVLGLELGVDFTFAGDNHKNHKNENDNPHLNFVKETVLGNKEQGVSIRDKGLKIRDKG